MKKNLTVLLLACTMLVFVTVPVFAGAPTDVGGTFSYVPSDNGDIRFAGPNQFWPSKDVEWWDGDLLGAAETTYTLILHGSNPMADRGQFVSKGSFVGTVLGSDEGSAAFQLTGHQKDGIPWYGTWSIGRGSGGLAGVHGQGTWMLDTNTFTFVYEGQVHFKP